MSVEVRLAQEACDLAARAHGPFSWPDPRIELARRMRDLGNEEVADAIELEMRMGVPLPSHHRADGNQNQNQNQNEGCHGGVGGSSGSEGTTTGDPLVDSEGPHMRQLLKLHAMGLLDPEPVDLPSLPMNPSRALRRLHDLLALRFGLRLADGADDALLLSASEVVAAGIVSTKGGASKLLHRAEDLGIVWSPGEMPALGKGNGTRLFLPGRRPEGPEPAGGWRVLPAE
jgi:hypothetical protein